MGVLRRDDDEPELAPAPGPGPLGELVDHVRQTGLAVDLQIVGEPRALPPGLDVSAYRIVQEALTNTVKHADGRQPPTSASATASGSWASRSPTTVPAERPRPRTDGHGLVGMRERVALYERQADRRTRDRVPASPSRARCRWAGPSDDGSVS